jgi:hypothetical protein
MARDRRSTETITALLSSAPALTPVPDLEDRHDGNNRPVKRVDQPGTSPERPVVATDDGYDDVDLEAFELQVDQPLVRPRRRRQVNYQTVRINKPTARILRQCWLAARQQDPLVSFTEFATIVTQRGLRALAEDRERERDEPYLH